ncbi:hypothetical protein HMPREF9129_2248 [Peptoniphilus indolicus ATCC 29427]|uniref:Uncharacterized protein n=1 Tax=Peptoniphilus indolicus ATCC 29427 TaxID=997350 RepID=G4D768_9FIRM|nr:hypothetical protein HMPREF9129_2248 [Peptoniphilus indolicus ATCC 29427]
MLYFDRYIENFLSFDFGILKGKIIISVVIVMFLTAIYIGFYIALSLIRGILKICIFFHQLIE